MSADSSEPSGKDGIPNIPPLRSARQAMFSAVVAGSANNVEDSKNLIGLARGFAAVASAGAAERQAKATERIAEALEAIGKDGLGGGR